MPSVPIATRAEIKLYGSISSTNQDALIDSLITPSLKAIGTFCNRKFEDHSVVEYRDGNGSRRLLLSHYPVSTFASLAIDGVTIPSSGYSIIAGSRRLVLDGYLFNEGLQNVVITYQAGYGDSGNVNPWPEDLKLAFMIFLITRLRERESFGIATKSLGGESVSYADTAFRTNNTKGIPAQARLILENYRNVVPELFQ